jgi:uncharacterized protein YdeI (YjbR/CyaY-like superfamily)
MAAAKPDYSLLHLPDLAAWEAWLEAHHASAPGAWVLLAKKGSALVAVSRADALDAALCYGWIDGQAQSLGAESWRQKFTPRGRRSLWSKVNRMKVDALIAEGRMRPAGLAEIERAKADGRWNRAYDAPSTATVPDDLAAALAADPKAAAFWDTLNKQNRYAITWRVQTAVKPATRARRIAQLVAMLAHGEKLHP